MRNMFKFLTEVSKCSRPMRGRHAGCIQFCSWVAEHCTRCRAAPPNMLKWSSSPCTHGWAGHAPSACRGCSVAAASGRAAVRATRRSRSRSHRSLIVQPAPRSSTAPAPNSASSVASGSAPGGAASAMEQKQGQASSHVPARLGQGKSVTCRKQQVPGRVAACGTFARVRSPLTYGLF
jgi:hypothetical protein